MAEANSPTVSSSKTDPNPCPICLASVTEDSYLDKCFHKFCYNCIIRWTDVVASKRSRASSTLACPLCKTENLSIIYGYDGASFQQHYICRSLRNSREFFSRAHRNRLKCYYTEPGDLADKLSVSRHWKLRKYLKQNHFLPVWLRREIQALMQVEDVDVIVYHILGVIDSLIRDWSNNPRISSEMARKEFRVSVSEAVRRFLTGRTERFVNELELFLASGLNIDAFDRVYAEHLGWEIHEINEADRVDSPLEQVPTVPCLYIFDEEDFDGN
ncbi:RING/U-box superfamily protein [Striga asiatica]|uniref:RING/U-box superfamily protein n=1 Tax=Striga asiatica TaxID=4170 RepID=A0A5A7RCE0_STRAF|nr:RING/U-box superfamily protein [Striga asiatica]